MYLFFDTETTGLPDYNAPLTDAKQPKIVSVAFILTDMVGREMAVYKAPITRDGFTVDEGGKAYEVNKLGNAALDQYGIDMKIALRMFRMFQDRASLKIAHNYRFDGFLLKGAHEALGVDPGPVIDKFCTMKVAEELKKQGIIERATLSAFYKHCTGKALEGAHDALSDVRACKDVFFWTLKQGLYKPQPRVVPGEKAA